MKIAVDLRYLGRSGIGRVSEGIAENLSYGEDEYFLIGKKEKISPFISGERGVTVIEDDSDPYSVKGLFSFDKRINKECEAYITPNFLVPFGIKIPVFTVMHDVIFLDVKSTTKGFFDRLIKKTLLRRCMKRSRLVLCVSEFTKKRVAAHFIKYANKTIVCYNGLSKRILGEDFYTGKKDDTLLYVGNVKPHKGLETLAAAYKLLPKGKFVLKIVGEKDNFAVGLNAESLSADGIEFTGRVGDGRLIEELKRAKFLIQPSLYEGFGLPPLEALYIGTKPIVSDIEVFKEIYDGLGAEFFKVGDAVDLKEKILSSDSEVADLRNTITAKYSFGNFTEELLKRVREKEKN